VTASAARNTKEGNTMNGRASAAIIKAAKADPRVNDYDVDEDAVIIYLAGSYAIKDCNDVLTSLTACTIKDYKKQMQQVFKA
jgi:hypothetical protein